MTWETCPECGVGRGADHKLSCSRRHPPVPADHSVRTVAEIQNECAARPATGATMIERQPDEG